MKVYNTLTKQLETFTPIKEGHVNMYVCGPTVYDVAHLGHGRSAVAFDVIRKYLIYKGYSVKFAFNYTDIDDKMIKRAAEEGIKVSELADKIIPHYEEDYGNLQVMKATVHPKATEYVESMINMTKALLDKEVAYKLEDGIYFDISKDEDYGKLSGQNIDDLKAGARVEERTDKRNHQDFVLWKFKKEGEPFWETEIGDGRPGWHIECSAMGTEILGETFDIHGGGVDLTFPHHECEIAQTETVTGKKAVNYWMHNGFIQIDNEKMSKSLGNFFTLKEIFEKYDPAAVRLFLISTHYRSPINFSDVQLEQAVNTLKRITDFIFNLKNYSSTSGNNGEVNNIIKKAKDSFENAMDNDFEVPEALAAIFTLIKEINTLMMGKHMSIEDAMSTLHFMREVNTVLGLFKEKEDESAIEIEIDELIQERELARKEKDYKKADQIRDELKEKGIELIDSSDGVKWRKV